MKLTVSTKGGIVLPAEPQELDGIVPGQQLEIKRLEAGRYLLTMSPASANERLVDWLLSCPEKNWFAAIHPGPSDWT